MPSLSTRATRALKLTLGGVVLLVFLYFFTGWVLYPMAYYFSSTTVTITVTEKDDKAKPGQTGSTFMVWGKHCGGKAETFEVTDSTMFMAWDSSDRWGKLERGETYKMEVAGWRIRLFSMYRNILKSAPGNC